MDPLTTLRRAGDPDGARTGAPARTRPDWAELVFRLVAFAVLVRETGGKVMARGFHVGRKGMRHRPAGPRRAGR